MTDRKFQKFLLESDSWEGWEPTISVSPVKNHSEGKTYWRGSLSTVGPLVVTILDQLLLILQTLIMYFFI
jgi:hypothetical protein